MKTLVRFLAIFVFIVSSCKKQAINSNNQMSAAPPLTFVILDKNGNNILDTLNLPKDSLTLTCSVNGDNTQFYDSIIYGFKENNTVVAFDYRMMLLSAGILSPSPLQMTTPVHTFGLSYHGNFLGTIYFEYLRWNYNQNTSWQEAKVFTFNNIPVKIDSSGGRHIYVIRLTQ